MSPIGADVRQDLQVGGSATLIAGRILATDQNRLDENCKIIVTHCTNAIVT